MLNRLNEEPVSNVKNQKGAVKASQWYRVVWSILALLVFSNAAWAQQQTPVNSEKQNNSSEVANTDIVKLAKDTFGYRSKATELDFTANFTSATIRQLPLE